MLYHNWCLKKTSSYSILSPQWIQWIGCFEKLRHILFHHHNESYEFWVFWKTSSYSISSPQWIQWIVCFEKLHHILFHHHDEFQCSGCFEKLCHILFHHHNELGVCKNSFKFFHFVSTMNLVVFLINDFLIFYFITTIQKRSGFHSKLHHIPFQ
jgi:hypothetical protein